MENNDVTISIYLIVIIVPVFDIAYEYWKVSSLESRTNLKSKLLSIQHPLFAGQQKRNKYPMNL